jgi:uncharacterized protein YndB with AHSA1/START domain
MVDNSRKDKPIQVSRVVSAGQQAAFEAFTEADKVKQWYGPKNFTCPVFKTDLRVGGKYLSCMRSPEDKDYRLLQRNYSWQKTRLHRQFLGRQRQYPNRL